MPRFNVGDHVSVPYLNLTLSGVVVAFTSTYTAHIRLDATSIALVGGWSGDGRGYGPGSYWAVGIDCMKPIGPPDNARAMSYHVLREAGYA